MRLWKRKRKITPAIPEKKQKQPFLEVFKGRREQWYFHLKAANNHIVSQSEGYTTKRGAIRGAITCKSTAEKAKTIRIKKQ